MSFRICSAVFLGVLAAAACATDDGSLNTNEDALNTNVGSLRASCGFTETYDADTMDAGHWALSSNSLRSRVIEPTGGNPGGYLYSEVGAAFPTWSTASKRYQPGVDDQARCDSSFVGDYYANHINHVSADLQVFQAGAWTSARAVTLHLVRWDVASDSVAFEAFYSLPDIPEVPTGWNRHDIPVDARSATVPPGWTFRRGDGSPGTDAEWATFMHQIDVVEFGYWKPGYVYPCLGLWKLGIDNIHVGA